MQAQELLEKSLPVVDRVVASVCRRARLYGADAEDFAATVRLRLLEDDGAILRQFGERSSLASYLAVVVQRMLVDDRSRNYGRWHASAEAKRLGPAAVLLETLVLRDRRSLDEAIPIVMSHHDVTREQLLAIHERLPVRYGRPRAVEIKDDDADLFAATQSAEERANESDQRRMSDHVSRVVRDALGSLTLEDRTLVRLRFGMEMSIADASRMMRLPQRPLYRRLESLIGGLRTRLVGAGVDARVAAELIGSAAQEMNFGLDEEPS